MWKELKTLWIFVFFDVTSDGDRNGSDSWSEWQEIEVGPDVKLLPKIEEQGQVVPVIHHLDDLATEGLSGQKRRQNFQTVQE